MNAYFRAFWAESLKLKRTLLFWSVFLAPLATGLMIALMVEGDDLRNLGTDSGWLYLQNAVIMFWAILMIPLLIALQTTLLSQLEHGEKNWKHLHALPIPRPAIYLAKWLMANLLALMSSLLLVVVVILTGLFLVTFVNPDNGLASPIPLGEMLSQSLSIYIMMLLAISIQTWVSIRWSSFLVPIGVGMVATFANIFVAQSEKWYYSLFPWSLGGNAIFKPELFDASLVLSLVGGV
ncbi:MAG TPA: ABC transporter permease, partial [Anaerolineaceae bacterium]|nr:ABC transporter permease [Anaerolineaceae bacterium]